MLSQGNFRPMIIFMKRFLFFLFFLLMWALTLEVYALAWQEIKGKHFVICYDSAADRSIAEKMLWRAEDSYQKVASIIGYARYSKFWTWGDRVKIFLFSDHQRFLDQTRQPAWSRGGALHLPNSDERIIVSYLNQPNLYNEVLPHEIAHLVLLDFIGVQNTTPQWFSEGVAQLAEQDKKEKADVLMRLSARLNAYFPFEALASYDVVQEGDGQKAAFFYAQSVSMVDFLLKRFGSEKFGAWCRQIATGKGFDEAFRFVYGSSLASWKDFETKWLEDLRD
jgi:hypothetical protein